MRGKYNQQAFDHWASEANSQRDERNRYWKDGILVAADFARIKELEAARDALFKKTVECMTKRQRQQHVFLSSV